MQNKTKPVSPRVNSPYEIIDDSNNLQDKLKSTLLQ